MSKEYKVKTSQGEELEGTITQEKISSSENTNGGNPTYCSDVFEY